eukprot:TRINITY_DN14851_c0_g1_i1.p1 TRINITY_DN14851_c0_g1~~TRINITY_DN14851_c0_g1_i1.p1  ORF type:complete len:820 (-),score=166.25 TRINITY_DN14851_c0_g1_i1:271-2730(-)
MPELALFEQYLVNNVSILKSILETFGENDDPIIWKSLTQIYIAYNRDFTLINLCTSRELDSSQKESLLFRGSGVSIRILSEYVKIFGQGFLRDTLGPSIRKIALGHSLEVDPCRLKPENSSELQLNRTELCKACQKIFDIIFNSSHQIPLRVKQVIRELNTKISKTFPNSFNRIVGAFFFLRFVCPAIVNPEQFGIINECSMENRRKLTLVTKLLQNIANESYSEEKEPYMSYFNDFVKSNVDKLPPLCERLLDITESQDQQVKPRTLFSYTLNVFNYMKSKSDQIKLRLVAHAQSTVSDDSQAALPTFGSSNFTSTPSTLNLNTTPNLSASALLESFSRTLEETAAVLAEDPKYKTRQQPRANFGVPARLSTPVASTSHGSSFSGVPRRVSNETVMLEHHHNRTFLTSSTGTAPALRSRSPPDHRSPISAQVVKSSSSFESVPSLASSHELYSVCSTCFSSSSSCSCTSFDSSLVDADGPESPTTSTSLSSSRERLLNSWRSSSKAFPIMNLVRKLSTNRELKRHASQSCMGALYEDEDEGSTPLSPLSSSPQSVSYPSSPTSLLPFRPHSPSSSPNPKSPGGAQAFHLDFHSCNVGSTGMVSARRATHNDSDDDDDDEKDNLSFVGSPHPRHNSVVTPRYRYAQHSPQNLLTQPQNPTSHHQPSTRALVETYTSVTNLLPKPKHSSSTPVHVKNDNVNHRNDAPSQHSNRPGPLTKALSCDSLKISQISHENRASSGPVVNQNGSHPPLNLRVSPKRNDKKPPKKKVPSTESSSETSDDSSSRASFTSSGSSHKPGRRRSIMFSTTSQCSPKHPGAL